jgi:replicative DNA helicase
MNATNPYHMELALIAGALIDGATLRVPEVRALKPHHFRHVGGAWRVITELSARGTEPSLTSLAPHVGKGDWPAALTLSGLMDVQAYSVRPHELPGAAAVVLNAYRHQQASTVAADLARTLSESDADHMTAMSQAQASLTDLLGTTPRDSVASVADDLDTALSRILNPQQHRGVTSGLPSLDATLGGWQPGTLNILAARPSMGKSALLGQLAQAAAFTGTRALLFTLEDGPTITRMRTLSRLAGVAINHDQAPPASSQARLNAAAEKLETLRERWLLDAESTLDGIISTAWRKHAESPLGLVLVDQLSHVLADAPRGKADNRTQLYGYVTKTLKREVAQRLGVPVILASQLSREVMRRGGEARPQLTDLRDSGELEQDADTVTFIHRPEYYDPEDSPGIAELIVAKNRNGATKTVKVSANMRLFKFWEGQA